MNDNPLWSYKTPRYILLAVIVVLALHPIASDDVWWQLSRGREVFNGTLSPSRTLLAGDVSYEADWFGGVPAFLSFSRLGFSGLMLAKIVVCLLVAVGLVTATNERRWWWSLPIIALGMAAVQCVLDPLPAAFDVLGVLAVWHLAHRWKRQPSNGVLSALVGTIVAWANVATLSLLGPLIFAAVAITPNRSPAKSSSWRQIGIATGLSVVALCATPRGPLTIWDSLRLLVPRLASTADALATTPWQATALGYWDASLILTVVLSFVCLVLLAIGRAGKIQIFLFFLIQAAIWSTRSNLPALAIWMTLLSLNRLQYLPQSPSPAAKKRKRFQAELVVGVNVVAFLLVAAVAAGWRSGQSTRPGWGLQPRLESRFLELAIAEMPLEGTAHCTDIRSAGMLSWLKRGKILPYDAPQRALLGGRLKEQALTTHELTRGLRNPYRRDDGSWGGWWSMLSGRETRLIVTSAENTSLIRGLEPTIWKPLSLESPVLAFGMAGDEICTPAIIQVVQQRYFLERGNYAYPLPAARGYDLYFDIWGAVTNQRDADTVLRLARALRAMELYDACLRVLLPLRRVTSSPDIDKEFFACHVELAYRERLAMGRASLWRMQILAATNRSSFVDGSLVRILGYEKADRFLENHPTRPAIKAYLNGDLKEAIMLLEGRDDESRYARAMLSLELGEDQAADSLR